VQVFKRLFDVDAFTSQPWADKLRDGPGLRALAAQTAPSPAPSPRPAAGSLSSPPLCGQALDLAVLSLIYLPTFYVFKAAVFSDAATGFEPAGCISSGIEKYQANFAKARGEPGPRLSQTTRRPLASRLPKGRVRPAARLAARRPRLLLGALSLPPLLHACGSTRRCPHLMLV